MTSTEAVGPGSPAADLAPAELYTQIQQFYARQMGLLDDGRPEEWALTFTQDAVFEEPHRLEPVRGREAIRVSARARADRLAAEGIDFRHWLAMLDVREQEDGTVRARTYALAMRTPRGGDLDIFVSVVCRDVLVRQDGTWAVRHRDIQHDGAE